MRRWFLTVGCVWSLVLSGCLSTHHEDYSTLSTVGIGPNGVAASSTGTFNVRDWTSPWFGQPDGARP
jgi:hypothetical protein